MESDPILSEAALRALVALFTNLRTSYTHVRLATTYRECRFTCLDGLGVGLAKDLLRHDTENVAEIVIDCADFVKNRVQIEGTGEKRAEKSEDGKNKVVELHGCKLISGLSRDCGVCGVKMNYKIKNYQNTELKERIKSDEE